VVTVARRSRGQVVEYDSRQGRSFALRFRHDGRRRYVTLGSESEGWTRAKADAELAFAVAQVERGSDPFPPKRVEQNTEAVEDPTFHEFASEWWDQRKPDLKATTRSAYEWELTHLLLPFFHRHTLSQSRRVRWTSTRRRWYVAARRERSCRTRRSTSRSRASPRSSPRRSGTGWSRTTSWTTSTVST
jgi:hypothetical protein